MGIGPAQDGQRGPAMIDLNRTVTVHRGHEGGAFKPKSKIHWSGTVMEFWEQNPTWSLVEMRDMLAALDRDGFSNIGGGPAAAPYVVRPSNA